MLDGHLGRISSTIPRVEFKPYAVPTFKMPYHAGSAKRDNERSDISKMHKGDVIEQGITKWAFPVVVAQKKNGWI